MSPNECENGSPNVEAICGRCTFNTESTREAHTKRRTCHVPESGVESDRPGRTRLGARKAGKTRCLVGEEATCEAR